jgi:indole-3-glycerol phosphate synthase
MSPSSPLSILEQIIAQTRVEVARAKTTTPLEVLKERVRELGRPRNFFAAVVDRQDRSRTRIIAEVKRRSPSAGEIREDFDPVDIAKQYEENGAAAISCLTNEPYFGGHLGYIQQIKSAVSLPVLRKDFIVDEYQVWESRAAGADAILLIAEVLNEAEMLDLTILAQKLGLTTLLEVHDVEKLLRVHRHVGFPHAGYSLLGINNRDLSTMTTDLGHTMRLLDMMEDDGVDTSVIVSESGIATTDDLARLRRVGVNIALVGESLMKRASPGEALRQLIGTSSRSA